MGHLNSFSASGGGNLNKNFAKNTNARGLPGGEMLKLRFDWYISKLNLLVLVDPNLLHHALSSLLSSDQSCEGKLSLLTEVVNFGLDKIMPVRSIKIHETDRPGVSTHLKQLIIRRRFPELVIKGIC